MHVSLLHVAFQTVNFLVLVYLLQRFFYRPILSVIAERKQKVLRDQEAASAEKLAAEKLQAEFLAKLAALEDDKQRVLHDALARAESEAASLRREMEKKIESERVRQQSLLKNERSEVERQLKEQSVRLGLSIAERLLRDGAVVVDPLAAVQTALAKVAGFAEPDQQRLWAEVRLHGAELASAEPMSDAAIAQAQAAIESACGGPVRCVTHIDPKLMLGVELRLGHLSFALHLRAGLAKVQSELLST